jgi:hypothetical protein
MTNVAHLERTYIGRSATHPLMESIISVALCVGAAVCVQAQDQKQSSTDQSWTATTETTVANSNPSRTTENCSKSRNRTVDKQRVEVLGLDGHYRPDSETETEIVRVNDTTRTVVREYGWDGNGRRTLSQVTEEEARSAASGDGQTVRTTSSSDVNGNLQVVKREIADTKKTSPDAQETKTKVYLADGNGGFNMAVQTQEVQKRSDDNKVEVKKTMLLPDGNGNWKVGEVKEKTIKDDGKKRTTEERVWRPDYEGRLSECSRTVGEETENSAGERTSIVETYSRDVPGSAEDGSMHQTQRVTTLQKRESNGETTEQQVEQPNPGNPSDGPQVTAKTKYTVRYAASGSEKTKTIQVRDGNGAFQVFSVETRKSEQVPPTQVRTAPSDKPQ